jgi:DnaJ-class molecular chaperone
MSEFVEEVRSYEPRDGVDYLVDLYGVTGVPHDASPDDIKGALKERSLEYHPDRLTGLAPEFRVRAERMILLINRARVVLLDDEKRVAYDTILDSWEGPVSTDGTPVLDLAAAIRTVMGRHAPD